MDLLVWSFLIESHIEKERLTGVVTEGTEVVEEELFPIFSGLFVKINLFNFFTVFIENHDRNNNNFFFN